MLTRFRLHDHAFTRMKVLGMSIAILETFLKQGVSRPVNPRCWEVSLADNLEQKHHFGEFASARVLVSVDGRVLDIQRNPAVVW